MASHSSKRCATVKKKFVPKMKPPEPVVEYVTPGGYELEKILNRDCMEYTHINQVWPNVWIGDEESAKDKYNLKKLGMTHILNAAEGTWNNVDTGAEYYSDMDVVYYGVVAEDTPTFDLSQYFFSAAQFIDQTLNIPENKLLVHCVMGRSRSATLFLAYLMICKNMTVVDAVDHVKRRRRIIPNWGFLKQLRQLDTYLLEQRDGVTTDKGKGGEEKDKEREEDE
ncbi:dual specificity phosphatase 29-like [Salvelinus alpinus]|uniref:dual specificity phosphatase 29 n=1 Tax=Salvelinus sp. IW2-2015 TaxID=2691554 RepID=UPI000CDFCEB0|nr:dual specificity phosphatase DUPD1 [Salvelinus alpinus]